jgi:glutathione S-transferase
MASLEKPSGGLDMKDLQLVIGNKNYSSWSLAPWLLLKMYDVDFDEVQVALYQDNTAEKLGPHSPSLKVPALRHKDDVTVWDSLSICEYLSEELLVGAGWPTGAKRRATARSVCAEMHSEFALLRREWPMNCSASVRMKPSRELRDEIARVDAIWSCCRRRYGENGTYLFGRFSIADCFMAPMALAFESYGAELSGDARAYMEALLDNPFVQSWKRQGQQEERSTGVALRSVG